ncbi:MAG: hypothetical protein PCFJNLEI_02825 [Verrucomicrobiae bacterium]|nr:hypothetical protein [Verrucomicrobiae bacterium]
MSFSASWLLIVFGVAVWAGFGWLGIMNWQRNPRRGVALLELLRFIIVGLIVLTLWRPEMRRLLSGNLQPTVAVLWDSSRSMTTRDVVEGEQALERQEWVERQRSLPVWKNLSNEFKLVSENFGTADETDINAALTKVAGSGANLRAVVVLSDGDWNTGSSPVAAATKLRSQGVPVFAVGVGAERYLPDLVLERVTAPEYALLGEQVYVGFTLKNFLDHDVKTTVTLRDNRGGEVKKPVLVPALGTTQEAIFWTSLYEGQSKLSVSVPAVEGEFRQDNNSQEFSIAIRKEILKVLIVESQPRWEYRFLRNAMQRDPGIDVKCVLFHLGMTVGAGRDYIPGMPQTKEALSQFDVVFLGDVGIGENELAPEDAENLKGLVEQQASGLVFLPGRRGRISSLAKSALGELLPVELDDKSPDGTGSADPARLILTQRGRGHLLTMLATTEDGNAELWKNLPGFYWFAPVRKSKGGADVLAVHELARNEHGRIPLLVTRQHGSGKVLFLGTDGAWRWRRGVEDTYHYRFWGQVVRWMAYQRHLAQEQGIRVFFTPENPKRGGTVHLHATAFDNAGLPLRGGRVIVEVTTPAKKVERLELRAVPGDWGVFESEFKAPDQGDYHLKARSETTGREVTAQMSVRGEDREQVGKPAQLEVLKEIARITQGDFGTGTNLETFVQRIEKLPEREAAEHRIRLWCHPVWGGLLMILLTIYWTGRKLVGMV